MRELFTDSSIVDSGPSLCDHRKSICSELIFATCVSSPASVKVRGRAPDSCACIYIRDSRTTYIYISPDKYLAPPPGRVCIYNPFSAENATDTSSDIYSEEEGRRKNIFTPPQSASFYRIATVSERASNCARSTREIVSLSSSNEHLGIGKTSRWISAESFRNIPFFLACSVRNRISKMFLLRACE